MRPASLEVVLDSRGRISVEGKKQSITRVAIGNLTGFEMALESLKESGFTGFRFGDTVTIECTDVQEASEQGRSAMPKFTVLVER